MKQADVIRSALHDAIGWQISLAEAYLSDSGNIERARALDKVAQYRALLRRRYGSDFTMHDETTGEFIRLADIPLTP